MRAIWPGALLVVYLVATGMLLVAGAAPAGTAIAWHAVLLLVVGGATLWRRVPGGVRAWMPLLVLLFLYSELPALIEAAGHAGLMDDAVIAWEAGLFGSQPARAWAAALPAALVSEPLHLAYLSYYPIIYAVPLALWLAGRRDDFDTAVFGLMLTFVACFACYIAFPVAGPRYLWTSAAPPGFFRATATWLLESRSSRGTAFPSSHVAVAVAQSVLALRLLGRRGLAVPVLTAGLAAGAVYGGFHYAVDVVAGAVLGGITASLALRLRAQANAIAPT